MTLLTLFLFICNCSVFSHFWTDRNFSHRKMDVIQALAGRASVNSRVCIWVFSFSFIWDWRNDELGLFFFYLHPYPGQIQPLLLWASALAEPHPALPRLWHPGAAVGPFTGCSLASTHHLKLNPAVILSLHAEGAGWFFASPLKTQETVKGSWKGKILCQEKEVQTPCVFCLSSGASGFRCSVSVLFDGPLPIGSSRCGLHWSNLPGPFESYCATVFYCLKPDDRTLLSQGLGPCCRMPTGLQRLST